MNGCTGNFSPPHKVYLNWVVSLQYLVLVSLSLALSLSHTRTHARTHSLTHGQGFFTSPLLPPVCLYTYSHSAGMERMYLRNVKPLKFTVKAATPPTLSPKGFQEHIFLTQVSSEVFEQLEGTGCNLGAQVPPRGLLSIFSGGRGWRLFGFFLSLILIFIHTLFLTPLPHRVFLFLFLKIPKRAHLIFI